jgi:transketolase
MLKPVMEATSNLDVNILYYTTIKPFDSESLIKNFNENIIVVEPFYEGSVNYLINKSLTGKKYSLTNIGVPHKFLTNYGTKEEHDINLKLDTNGLKEKIEYAIQ